VLRPTLARGLRLRAILLASLAVLLAAATAGAGPARVLKVLPFRLDLQGRQSLSPSLYERDAYQAWLRENPRQVSGLRFDVNWKGPSGKRLPLKLKLELRTPTTDPAKPIAVESEVKPDRLGSTWSRVMLSNEVLRGAIEVTAWRASLWDGDRMLTEQKSFLW
jgi:hypothetical protein